MLTEREFVVHRSVKIIQNSCESFNKERSAVVTRSLYVAAVVLLLTVVSSAMAQQERAIPHDQLPKVKEFVQKIDSLYRQLNREADRSLVRRATVALQRFRPDWEIRVSQPLSKNDALGTLIEIADRDVGGLYRDPVTGKIKSATTKLQNYCFILKRGDIWKFQQSIYDYVEAYRSFGDVYVLLDARRWTIRTVNLFEAERIFHFFTHR